MSKDIFPILTVQKGCNKLCCAFSLREGGGDADKNVRTLGGGVSQKRTKAYKGGRRGKKVTILSVRTFWMIPFGGDFGAI